MSTVLEVVYQPLGQIELEIAAIGPKGDKGDTGDVNPEMYTILSDAELARDSAISASETASTQAGLATKQAGLASDSADAASLSEINAGVFANTAETQAGIATTQSGIAATKASEAGTAKTGAETARDAAIAAKTGAETARDAAIAAKTASETAQAAAEDVLTNPDFVRVVAGVFPPRVVDIADGNSITMNADTTDIARQDNTQSAGILTINAPTGTPYVGQKLVLRIKSNNIQTLSWDSVFAGSDDLPLPVATSGSGKMDYYGFLYSTTVSKWQLLGKIGGF